MSPRMNPTSVAACSSDWAVQSSSRNHTASDWAIKQLVCRAKVETSSLARRSIESQFCLRLPVCPQWARSRLEAVQNHYSYRKSIHQSAKGRLIFSSEDIFRWTHSHGPLRINCWVYLGVVNWMTDNEAAKIYEVDMDPEVELCVFLLYEHVCFVFLIIIVLIVLEE